MTLDLKNMMLKDPPSPPVSASLRQQVSTQRWQLLSEFTLAPKSFSRKQKSRTPLDANCMDHCTYD